MTAAQTEAAQLIDSVRDDPAGRLQLAHETYGALGAWATAELAFMRWEVERGVLDGAPGGSPWWRAVNEGLLRDACEAHLLHAGNGAESPSTPATAAWLAFFVEPSARAWYRAHNASVVAGYLATARLAAAEREQEQRLMNLTLMRVLYAEALEEDEPLGLGPLAHLGRLLANPRATGVGDVVEVPDLYPRHYPLDRQEDAALDHRQRTAADAFVALIDDDMVFPRLDQLYRLGAETLPAPELALLEQRGRPTYPRALLEPDPEARAAAVVATAPPVHHDLPWVCAQRWEQVLFVSWRVPVAVVRALVPAELELDLHDGDAWVSLLPLKMAHVHLRDLPGAPDLTNFPELNLRTYVRHEGEPGVFFFSLDAPSRLAVWIGRHVFHVAYDAARMTMTEVDGSVRFTSAREGADATFAATYRGVGQPAPAAPGSMELFLCERYAMYGRHPDGALVRGDIRHSPWQLQGVDLDLQVGTVLQAAGLHLDRPPDHTAYSAATDNVVWPMCRV